jgi:hypothetical protein
VEVLAVANSPLYAHSQVHTLMRALLVFDPGSGVRCLEALTGVQARLRGRCRRIRVRAGGG